MGESRVSKDSCVSVSVPLCLRLLFLGLLSLRFIGASEDLCVLLTVMSNAM